MESTLTTTLISDPNTWRALHSRQQNFYGLSNNSRERFSNAVHDDVWVNLTFHRHEDAVTYVEVRFSIIEIIYSAKCKYPVTSCHSLGFGNSRDFWCKLCHHMCDGARDHVSLEERAWSKQPQLVRRFERPTIAGSGYASITNFSCGGKLEGCSSLLRWDFQTSAEWAVARIEATACCLRLSYQSGLSTHPKLNSSILHRLHA